MWFDTFNVTNSVYITVQIVHLYNNIIICTTN